MMMALAGVARPAGRARARRRDAAADGRRGRRQGADRSARASRTARSRWRRRPSWAAAPAASPAAAASSSARRRRRRWSAEALGLALPHRALAPSGQPIWLDMARRSARALRAPATRAASTMRDDPDAEPRCDNAMVRPRGVRRLDEPAAAHPGDRPRRRAARGRRSRTGPRSTAQVPRLVDALPNGPRDHPTVQVFLAGGVPEVMLHLRALGLLDTGRADRRPARRSARCSTGGSERAPARGCARGCASATASIPTT